MKSIGILVTALIIIVDHVKGHGYLIDPPSRSSEWRVGFNTTKNYVDDQLNCGGLKTFIANGYKCGVCGDPYNGAKDNEFPNGMYAKSPVPIVKTYTKGSEISAKITLTASHGGFFVFKICSATSATQEVTQDCLDKNVLPVSGATTPGRYTLPKEDGEGFRGNLTIGLTLPAGLTCDRCVLQWTWTAGNQWGKCDNGTSAVGCGPDQETFRNCADVKIQ